MSVKIRRAWPSSFPSNASGKRSGKGMVTLGPAGPTPAPRGFAAPVNESPCPTAEMNQVIPIGIVAGKPRNLQAHHDSDLATCLLLVPSHGSRLLGEAVLSSLALKVLAHRFERRLSDVHECCALVVFRSAWAWPSFTAHMPARPGHGSFSLDVVAEAPSPGLPTLGQSLCLQSPGSSFADVRSSVRCRQDKQAWGRIPHGL